MIVYASSKSGKTTWCNNHRDWIDGDKHLFKLLNKAFNVTIIDNDDKGLQIIELFHINRMKAEKCYTAYMEWLKDNKFDLNILLGSRRFMWLADKVIIKENKSSDLYNHELASVLKWRIKYTTIKIDEFLNEKLLKNENNYCII